jgi:hypothetical protein
MLFSLADMSNIHTTTARPVTIQDLKREQDQKLSALFAECGVFWAFSEEQFHKNKTPLQEGEKYVSIGAGGYLPKGHVSKFSEGMERIRKEFNAAVNASRKQRRAFIAYELNNHEAHYTGDITDTMQALGKGFTAKEVRKVYAEMEANA